VSGPRRRRLPALKPEDVALWEQVKASVEPLRRRGVKPIPAPPPDPLEPAGPLVKAHEPPPRPAARPTKPSPPRHGLEKALIRRVRRGAEPIARRLDLHGLCQDEAHRQLLAFVKEAQRRGDRVVLLITGKGSANPLDDGERGVLRRAVPRWLKLPDFHAFVVGFSEAERSHGGAGALYVHIRRQRQT
jgi:DNA-nicking Smr family endonuclease